MASGARVNVNDFYSVIAQVVKKNVEHNSESLSSDIRQAGRDCAKDLQGSSPERTGRYAKGWKSSFREGERGHSKATVHNTTKPGLTHLLENGHEMFIAGHDTGRRVPAHPHIADAYERAAEKLRGITVDNP